MRNHNKYSEDVDTVNDMYKDCLDCAAEIKCQESSDILDESFRVLSNKQSTDIISSEVISGINKRKHKKKSKEYELNSATRVKQTFLNSIGTINMLQSYPGAVTEAEKQRKSKEYKLNVTSREKQTFLDSIKTVNMFQSYSNAVRETKCQTVSNFQNEDSALCDIKQSKGIADFSEDTSRKNKRKKHKNNSLENRDLSKNLGSKHCDSIDEYLNQNLDSLSKEKKIQYVNDKTLDDHGEANECKTEVKCKKNLGLTNCSNNNDFAWENSDFTLTETDVYLKKKQKKCHTEKHEYHEGEDIFITNSKKGLLTKKPFSDNVSRIHFINQSNSDSVEEFSCITAETANVDICKLHTEDVKASNGNINENLLNLVQIASDGNKKKHKKKSKKKKPDDNISMKSFHSDILNDSSDYALTESSVKRKKHSKKDRSCNDDEIFECDVNNIERNETSDIQNENLDRYSVQLHTDKGRKKKRLHVMDVTNSDIKYGKEELEHEQGTKAGDSFSQLQLISTNNSCKKKKHKRDKFNNYMNDTAEIIQETPDDLPSLKINENNCKRKTVSVNNCSSDANGTFDDLYISPDIILVEIDAEGKNSACDISHKNKSNKTCHNALNDSFQDTVEIPAGLKVGKHSKHRMESAENVVKELNSAFQLFDAVKVNNNNHSGTKHKNDEVKSSISDMSESLKNYEYDTCDKGIMLSSSVKKKKRYHTENSEYLKDINSKERENRFTSHGNQFLSKEKLNSKKHFSNDVSAIHYVHQTNSGTTTELLSARAETEHLDKLHVNNINGNEDVSNIWKIVSDGSKRKKHKKKHKKNKLDENVSLKNFQSKLLNDNNESDCALMINHCVSKQKHTKRHFSYNEVDETECSMNANEGNKVSDIQNEDLNKSYTDKGIRKKQLNFMNAVNEKFNEACSVNDEIISNIIPLERNDLEYQKQEIRYGDKNGTGDSFSDLHLVSANNSCHKKRKKHKLENYVNNTTEVIQKSSALYDLSSLETNESYSKRSQISVNNCSKDSSETVNELYISSDSNLAEKHSRDSSRYGSGTSYNIALGGNFHYVTETGVPELTTAKNSKHKMKTGKNAVKEFNFTYQQIGASLSKNIHAETQCKDNEPNSSTSQVSNVLKNNECDTSNKSALLSSSIMTVNNKIHKSRRKHSKLKVSENTNISDVHSFGTVPDVNSNIEASSNYDECETYSVKSFDDETKNALNKSISEENNIPSNTDNSSTDSSSEENFSFDPYSKPNSFLSVQLDTSEDPLDFEPPLLHERGSVCRLSDEKIKLLESQGVKIKSGRWSKEEVSILTRNYKEFIEKFGVDDPFLLFGISQYERNGEVQKFLRAKHFYVRLGKGLNDRTLKSVYQKARHLFNPMKRSDRYGEVEISKLSQVHSVTGNKWEKIGVVLRRDGNSCRDTYRWYKKKVNKGKWTQEEESNLIKAIEKVTGTTNFSSDKLIHVAWEKVAQLVPTRNSAQCEKHFRESLAWTCDPTLRQKWDRICYEKLIYILKNENYIKDETEIDWRKIHESFRYCAPSYAFVRKKWHKLKSKIPDFKERNFRRIVHLLYKNYDECKLFLKSKNM
ncbi:Cyclin-D-binding Myb-like transcription factor 1, partial [Stegodyphus mimosarum]